MGQSWYPDENSYHRFIHKIAVDGSANDSHNYTDILYSHALGYIYEDDDYSNIIYNARIVYKQLHYDDGGTNY